MLNKKCAVWITALLVIGSCVVTIVKGTINEFGIGDNRYYTSYYMRANVYLLGCLIAMINLPDPNAQPKPKIEI
jgi:hypothetical protein